MPQKRREAFVAAKEVPAALSALEQLVAVHRQLLRKYAALELNLGESAKMIALRDERILALERESSDGFAAATAETQV